MVTETIVMANAIRGQLKEQDKKEQTRNPDNGAPTAEWTLRAGIYLYLTFRSVFYSGVREPAPGAKSRPRPVCTGRVSSNGHFRVVENVKGIFHDL